ncbi:hypothetical protein BOTBODRAFT_155012 [Botryobasidium botryosum FD-172 SS1]|uniref:Cytochrome P450 n=1 Tax=Botryobasidium botryosum (strain FD-172 SS1) TaxID=930990 RepID=A0A067MQI3_BOTB1|nr:hypothetical protein BOTBODRAFT_155012 [Botryobasidium botryosum FD-172 SS1]
MLNFTIDSLLSDHIGDATNLSLWTSAALSAGVLAVLYYQLAAQKSDGFNHLPGIPLIGSWDFFTKRSDFVRLAIAANKNGGISKFKLLNHNVVVVTQEQGRRFFFGDKNLNFQEGYAVLWGGAPKVEDAVKRNQSQAEQRSYFNKRVISLLRRDRLGKIVPQLFKDLNNRMDTWPQSGRANPFDNIYRLVFQMTVRALALKELADSPAALEELSRLYWGVEKSTSATSVLLPWFPSRTRRNRKDITAELYQFLADPINKRKAEGRIEDDAAQFMIEQGDSTENMVTFVMAAIFAGIITTGMNICWLLLHVNANPEWSAKLQSEIQALLSEHSPDTTLPIHVRLSQIPIGVWEDSTPILDLMIQETIRVTINIPLLRRNVDSDVKLDGATVKKGDFMAYPLEAAHLDPENYADPMKWNPGRWEDPAEVEKHKAQLTFMGWGAGMHPCLGMRFAKLEMKFIAALYTSRFEYTRVDKHGAPVKGVPEPDLNDLYRASPKGGEVFFEYKPKMANGGAPGLP